MELVDALIYLRAEALARNADERDAFLAKTFGRIAHLFDEPTRAVVLRLAHAHHGSEVARWIEHLILRFPSSATPTQ